MPKRLTLLLVIVSALLLSVLPLRAQPSVAELLRFADDAPFNAVMFGAIRSDSAYIETLDGVIAQVTSAFPPGFIPLGLSVTGLLDMASLQITGSGFSQGLRPLLGDVAAFAVGDLGTQIDSIWYNDDNLQIAFYLAVADRAAADQLVSNLTRQLGVPTVTARPDGTLYTVGVQPTFYVLVRDDAVILTLSPDMLPNGGASLNDNPYFQSAVGSLPAEGGYNIIGYVDVAYFASALIGSDRWLSGDSRIAQMLIFRSLGVIASGATILDGRTLTGDVVLSPGNLQPLESFGIDVRGAPRPINSALINRIPSDSALVWHGTYPLGAFDLVDRSISSAVEGLFGAVLDADPVSRAAFDSLGATLMFYPNALLTNLGGLTFEDYAEWLQGDYLVVMRPNFSYAPFPGPGGLPFDGGIILEAANPESARERMLRFARELTLMLRAGALARNANIIPIQTRIGDADAVILRGQAENFSDRSVSYLDFAIAADDQVMAIGTLDFVETVLGNADADSSPFDADQGVLLPESRLALYVNPRTLSAMALPIFGYNWDFNRPNTQLPLLALTLFDSSTASLTFDEAGNTVMRFTLTLAEDQAANAAAATATYEAFAATATAIWEQYIPPSTPTPFPSPTGLPPVTGVLNIGDTVRGNLAVGAQDVYLIDIASGDEITIDMDADFDTVLEVRGITDPVVIINDDRGDGTRNSRIFIGNFVPGRYTVIARSYWSSDGGPYTLTVRAGLLDLAPTSTPFAIITPTETPTSIPFVTPTPAALAQAIRIGETITGNLVAGGRDAYSLVVPSNAAITIDMEAGFDTFLELRDSADAVIMINDDRGDGTFNSRITADLSAGTYTIIARAFSTAASGAYTLSVSTGSAAAATPTPTATPIGGSSAAGTIAVGETVTGVLAAGARDAYRITVAAGETFTIDMEAGFDTFLELRDASDAVVASNDDRGDGTFNSRIVVDNPAAGTYTIIARAFASSGSGTYTLRVSAGAVVPPTATLVPTSTPSAAGTIAIGETVTGVLAAGARDAYILDIPANTSVVIDLDSAAFDTYLELLDPSDNSMIDFNDDRGDGTFNSRISIDLTPGRYAVVVRGFSTSDAGAYTLRVSGGSAAAATPTPTAPSAAGTIAVGQTVTATLARGQRNQHTFTAAAGEIITIDMEASFDTYLRLLDANGRMIAENDDRGDGTYNSRIRSFSIPAAGTYTISAGSFGDASGGDYTLTLSRG
jgi:hypothetical protein